MKDGFSSQTITIDSLDYYNGFPFVDDVDQTNALSFSLVLKPVSIPGGGGGGGGGSNSNPPLLGETSAASLGIAEEGFGGTLTQKDLRNQKSPHSVSTGETLSLRFDLNENQGINNIYRVSLSLTPSNPESSLLNQGETVITFFKYKPLMVNDPNNFLSKTDFVILERDSDDFVLKFDIVLNTPGEFDLDLEVWDLDRNTAQETFASAIIVQSHTSNSVDTTGSADIASDQLTKDVKSISKEEFIDEAMENTSVVGSSENSPYQNRHTLFTSQMDGAPTILIEAADTPAPKAPEIPIWVKNNVRWWSEDEIDDEDFLAGIKYLTEQKIIVVTQTQVTFDSVTQQEIPYYVKRSASWWSEGIITDDEFLQVIQWWINEGIVKV